MPTPRNIANTEKQLIFTDVVLEGAFSTPEVQQIPGFGDIQLGKEYLRKNMAIGNAGVDSLLTISLSIPMRKLPH